MSTPNFSFNLSNTPAVSTSTPRLKPYEIHRVKFVGARVEDVQGKKDPEAKYRILKVRFENTDGYYEESIFFPTEKDCVRNKRTNAQGHEVEMVSNFERTMAFVAQLGTVLNPVGYEKMKGLSFQNFDDVCKALIAITDPVKGEETNLKLIGRISDGKLVPCLPYFISLNKEGQTFISDNFIGEKVFFTAYEEGKREEMRNAKPTNVEAQSNTPKEESKENTSDLGGIDFSKLV